MKLHCPRVQTSACGCSLQTGSKIIGYVSTLVGIGLLVSGISLALDKHEQERGTHKQEMDKLSLIIGATSAGYGLIFFIVSFLLLCGAIQAKRRCMLPFLVFAYLNIVLIVVLIPWIIYEGFFILTFLLIAPLCK
ncbi:uncharacterized protein LOC111052800 [Nilaparvata lugens]|uniref:uncharacterized protein LOC111052800 n=1 Tax=Nilaparvata lugens TaxID=108931 RepID=UPI00193DCBC7|nr:uncharacterized protein LOC111052800 [Nilaparvata lugens]